MMTKKARQMVCRKSSAMLQPPQSRTGVYCARYGDPSAPAYSGFPQYYHFFGTQRSASSAAPSATTSCWPMIPAWTVSRPDIFVRPVLTLSHRRSVMSAADRCGLWRQVGKESHRHMRRLFARAFALVPKKEAISDDHSGRDGTETAEIGIRSACFREQGQNI